MSSLEAAHHHPQQSTTMVPPIFGLLEKHWWDGNAFAVVHQRLQKQQQQQETTDHTSIGHTVAVVIPLVTKSSWEKEQEAQRNQQGDDQEAESKTMKSCTSSHSNHLRHTNRQQQQQQYRRQPSLVCPSFAITKMDFLPRSALRVENLAILDLSNSRLSDLGSGAAWRSVAKTLKVLYLHDNRITRYAFVESVLSELYNLQHLTLAGNFIEAPKRSLSGASVCSSGVSLRQVIAQSFFNLLVLDEHFILDVERLDFVYVESRNHRHQLVEQKKDDAHLKSSVGVGVARRSLYVPFAPHTYIGCDRTSYQLRKDQIERQQRKLERVTRRFQAIRQRQQQQVAILPRTSSVGSNYYYDDGDLPRMRESALNSRLSKFGGVGDGPSDDNEFDEDDEEERLLMQMLSSTATKRNCNNTGKNDVGHAITAATTFDSLLTWEWKHLRFLPIRAAALSPAALIQKCWRRYSCQKKYEKLKAIKNKKQAEEKSMLRRSLSRSRSSLVTMMMMASGRGDSAEDDQQKRFSGEGASHHQDQATREKMQAALEVLSRVLLRYCRTRRGLKKMLLRKIESPLPNAVQGDRQTRRYVIFIDELQMHRWERWVDELNNTNHLNCMLSHSEQQQQQQPRVKLLRSTEGAESLKRKYVEYERLLDLCLSRQQQQQQQQSTQHIQQPPAAARSHRSSLRGQQQIQTQIQIQTRRASLARESDSRNNLSNAVKQDEEQDNGEVEQEEDFSKTATMTANPYPLVLAQNATLAFSQESCRTATPSSQNAPKFPRRDSSTFEQYHQQEKRRSVVSLLSSEAATNENSSVQARTRAFPSTSDQRSLLATREGTAAVAAATTTNDIPCEKDRNGNQQQQNITSFSYGNRSTNNNNNNNNNNNSNFSFLSSAATSTTDVKNTSLCPILVTHYQQQQSAGKNCQPPVSPTTANVIANKLNKTRRKQIMSLVEPWYASWPSWHTPASDKRDVGNWDLIRSVVTASYNPRKFLYRASMLKSSFGSDTTGSLHKNSTSDDTNNNNNITNVFDASSSPLFSPTMSPAALSFQQSAASVFDECEDAVDNDEGKNNDNDGQDDEEKEDEDGEEQVDGFQLDRESKTDSFNRDDDDDDGAHQSATINRTQKKGKLATKKVKSPSNDPLSEKNENSSRHLLSPDMLNALVTNSIDKKQQRVVRHRKFVRCITESISTHLPATKDEVEEVGETMARQKAATQQRPSIKDSIRHKNNNNNNSNGEPSKKFKVNPSGSSSSIFSGMIISEARRQSLAEMMAPSVRVGAPAHSQISAYQSYDSASPVLRSFKATFGSKERREQQQQQEFDRSRLRQFASTLFRVKQRTFTPIPLQAVECDTAETMTTVLLRIHFVNKLRPRSQIHFFFEDDLLKLRAATVLQAWWRGTWTRLRFQSWQVFTLAEERRQVIRTLFGGEGAKILSLTACNNEGSAAAAGQQQQQQRRVQEVRNDRLHVENHPRFATSFPLTRNLWNYNVARRLRVGPSIVLFSCIQIQNWWRVILSKRRYHYLNTLHSVIESHIQRQSSRLYVSSTTLLALLKEVQQVFSSDARIGNYGSTTSRNTSPSQPQQQDGFSNDHTINDDNSNYSYNYNYFCPSSPSLGQTPHVLSPRTTNLIQLPPHLQEQQQQPQQNYFAAFNSVTNANVVEFATTTNRPPHLVRRSNSPSNNLPPISVQPPSSQENALVEVLPTWYSSPCRQQGGDFSTLVSVTAGSSTNNNNNNNNNSYRYNFSSNVPSQHGSPFRESGRAADYSAGSVLSTQSTMKVNRASEHLARELSKLQLKVDDNEFIARTLSTLANKIDAASSSSSSSSSSSPSLVALCNHLLPELASVHRDTFAALAETLRLSSFQSREAALDAKHDQAALIQKATASAIGDASAGAAASAIGSTTAAVAGSTKSSSTSAGSKRRTVTMNLRTQRLDETLVNSSTTRNNNFAVSCSSSSRSPKTSQEQPRRGSSGGSSCVSRGAAAGSGIVVVSAAAVAGGGPPPPHHERNQSLQSSSTAGGSSSGGTAAINQQQLNHSVCCDDDDDESEEQLRSGLSKENENNNNNKNHHRYPCPGGKHEEGGGDETQKMVLSEEKLTRHGNNSNNNNNNNSNNNYDYDDGDDDDGSGASTGGKRKKRVIDVRLPMVIRCRYTSPEAYFNSLMDDQRISPLGCVNREALLRFATCVEAELGSVASVAVTEQQQQQQQQRQQTWSIVETKNRWMSNSNTSNRRNSLVASISSSHDPGNAASNNKANNFMMNTMTTMNSSLSFSGEPFEMGIMSVPPALVSKENSLSLRMQSMGFQSHQHQQQQQQNILLSSQMSLQSEQQQPNEQQQQKQKRHSSCCPAPSWLLKFAAAAALLHGCELTQFFTGEFDSFGQVVKKVSAPPPSAAAAAPAPVTIASPFTNTVIDLADENATFSRLVNTNSNTNSNLSLPSFGASNDSFAGGQLQQSECQELQQKSHQHHRQRRLSSSTSPRQRSMSNTQLPRANSPKSPSGHGASTTTEAAATAAAAAAAASSSSSTPTRISNDEARRRARQTYLCKKVIDIWSRAYKHSTNTRKKSLEQQQQERNKRTMWKGEDPNEKCLLAVGPNEGNILERIDWLVYLCEKHPDGFLAISAVASNEALSRFLLVASLTWQLPFGELLCPEPLERLRSRSAVQHIEKWWLSIRQVVRNSKKRVLKRRQAMSSSATAAASSSAFAANSSSTMCGVSSGKKIVTLPSDDEIVRANDQQQEEHEPPGHETRQPDVRRSSESALGKHAAPKGSGIFAPQSARVTPTVATVATPRCRPASASSRGKRRSSSAIPSLRPDSVISSTRSAGAFQESEGEGNDEDDDDNDQRTQQQQQKQQQQADRSQKVSQKKQSKSKDPFICMAPLTKRNVQAPFITRRIASGTMQRRPTAVLEERRKNTNDDDEAQEHGDERDNDEGQVVKSFDWKHSQRGSETAAAASSSSSRPTSARVRLSPPSACQEIRRSTSVVTTESATPTSAGGNRGGGTTSDCLGLTTINETKQRNQKQHEEMVTAARSVTASVRKPSWTHRNAPQRPLSASLKARAEAAAAAVVAASQATTQQQTMEPDGKRAIEGGNNELVNHLMQSHDRQHEEQDRQRSDEFVKQDDDDIDETDSVHSWNSGDDISFPSQSSLHPTRKSKTSAAKKNEKSIPQLTSENEDECDAADKATDQIDQGGNGERKVAHVDDDDDDVDEDDQKSNEFASSTSTFNNDDDGDDKLLQADGDSVNASQPSRTEVVPSRILNDPADTRRRQITASSKSVVPRPPSGIRPSPTCLTARAHNNNNNNNKLTKVSPSATIVKPVQVDFNAASSVTFATFNAQITRPTSARLPPSLQARLEHTNQQHHLFFMQRQHRRPQSATSTQHSTVSAGQLREEKSELLLLIQNAASVTKNSSASPFTTTTAFISQNRTQTDAAHSFLVACNKEQSHARHRSDAKRQSELDAKLEFLRKQNELVEQEKREKYLVARAASRGEARTKMPYPIGPPLVPFSKLIPSSIGKQNDK